MDTFLITNLRKYSFIPSDLLTDRKIFYGRVLVKSSGLWYLLTKSVDLSKFANHIDLGLFLESRSQI